MGEVIGIIREHGIVGALTVAVVALAGVVVHLHRALITAHQQFARCAIELTHSTTAVLADVRTELARRRERV